MSGRISKVFGAAAMFISCGGGLNAQPALDTVNMAADYLISVQEDTGLYAYEYDFLAGAWVTADNIVRQAGASYSLALYYSETGDEGARESVIASLGAFSAMSAEFGGGQLLTADGTVETGSAGATALALIAALLAEGPTERAELWLKGLVALQRPDGRFAATPSVEAPNGYFDGESWLALAHAAQAGLLDEDTQQALAKADAGLVETYQAAPDVTFFHWGQLAAARRYQSTSDPRFIMFSAQQVASYLGEFRPRVSRYGNGCYGVEGLAAAWTMLTNDARFAFLADNVELRIERLLEIAAALQIQPGAEGISFRDGVYLTVPEIDRFAGAFLNGLVQPRTRIDSTQHCLAAFLSVRKNAIPAMPD